MTNKIRTSGDNSPVLNDCDITIFNQVKSESVIMRKNQLYIPLFEELLNIKNECSRGDLFSLLTNPFINEVILKQYKYRLEDSLLTKLNELDSTIIAFNKIDIISISGNIIVNMFTKGFIELYGDIIDGEAPIHYDGEIVDYEPVYPEEYDNIRLIAYNTEFVKGVIKDQHDFVEFDDELYNKSLVSMFEFALAERNKKYSPSRFPVNNWKDEPEFYIASITDFYELFNSDLNITIKRNKILEISNLCNKLTLDIDVILKSIYERYEKE